MTTSSGISRCRSPPAPTRSMRHSRHLYQVLVGQDACMSRDELLDFLVERRIGAGVHYRGVHLHPYYRDRYGLRPAAFPVATDISERTISLPLSPGVSAGDQLDVTFALRDGLCGSARPAVALAAGSP